MALSAGSTLAEVYESYDAIAPAKFAGKLEGKVVSHSLCGEVQHHG